MQGDGMSRAGKHALMEQLIADGVRYVFGNPGTTEQPFMDALQDHPELEFILCLHEGVAVSMADAYARATGKPAFVQLHIAPGLGNAIGMIFNATTGRAPLVLYAGQSSTDTLFQEPLLSGDLVGMARPVTKWAFEVGHAADVPQALRRAMKIADAPPQGPAFLSIPMDVMDQSTDAPVMPTSFTRWRVRPDAAAIAEAADILSKSERPLVIIGDGIAACEAQDELAKVAELIGAPIQSGYASEINVASDHPLNRGSFPRTTYDAATTIANVVAKHDVVLAAGTPFFRLAFPKPGGMDMGSARVIQMDIDAWEIGKNIPGGLGIQGDLKSGLAELADLLRTRRPKGADERARTIGEATRTKRDDALAADRKTWDSVPISPARLMSEVAAALPTDAAVFEEAISNSLVLGRYITPHVGRYFRARGGGIGPGMPGTVGLQLAMPERKVVGIVSDGASMYSITALWTAAHHKIPAVFVVCNNSSYQILKQNVLDYLGAKQAGRKFVAMDLADPPLRFDKLAEAMGVHGRRVEKPEQIRASLEEALALGAPALIDVAIAETVRRA
jgi:thiamine pyrophosphate-dependent acetolactate synthase large subunit-like protein